MALVNSAHPLNSMTDLKLLRALQDYAAEIYLVTAVVMLSIFTLLTPPFFSPDEIAHSERAIGIAHGQWLTAQPEPGSLVSGMPDHPQIGGMVSQRVATKKELASGAPIDTNFLVVAVRSASLQHIFMDRYSDLPQRYWPDGRISLSDFKLIKSVRWSGTSSYISFQNTAVYPPPLYFPAAVAWRLGEHFRLTIVNSLYLARAFNSLCAVLLGWVALRLAGPERLLYTAILLLPSLLAMEASCSQDAILIPLSMLMASVLGRALRGKRSFYPSEMLFLGPALALCITARPPYIWLLVVLALPEFDRGRLSLRDMRLPVWSAACILVLVAAWRYCIRNVGLFHSPAAEPSQQLAYIRTHLLHSAYVLIAGTVAVTPSLLTHLIEVEVKSLPILNILVALHYLAFLTILVLAARTSLMRNRSRLLLGLCMGATLLAMSAAEYVIWSAPGSSKVEGLQSRYLLPLLACFLFLMPGFLSTMRQTRVNGKQHFARIAVAASAAVFVSGVLATPFLLSHRYFGVNLVTALHSILA